MATINNSIIGFENYLRNYNLSLFTSMVLPEGIDKETLINNILNRGGEFESLYGDPEYMTFAIGVWSQKMYFTFDKWVKTMSSEFNPIENYDRYEEMTRANTGKQINEGTTRNTGDVINHGTSVDAGDVTDNGSTTNKVSAYNADALRDDTKDETTNTHTLNTTNTVDNRKTNDLKTASNDTRTDDLHEKIISHIHGNVGVTTATAMMSEANEMYLMWNLYDKITDLFIAEFAIMVY